MCLVFIDAILSVLSGFMAEQCISAINCSLLFSSLEKLLRKSLIFCVIHDTKFSEIRHFN